jgi:hypothetical protein
MSAGLPIFRRSGFGDNSTPFVWDPSGLPFVGTESAIDWVMKINLDPDHLAKLRAELSAIELWDTRYYRSKVRDTMDDDSFRARQKRREEILNEILDMVGTDRSFRLRFGLIN